MATLTIGTTAGEVVVAVPEEAMARVLAIMPGGTEVERAQALGAELVAHCQRQVTDAVVRAAHEVADAFIAAVREQASGG